MTGSGDVDCNDVAKLQNLLYLTITVLHRYKLKTSPDHEWGILANGKWTGMMGMLIRNEADVALGPFALNYDRYKAVEVTTPVIMSHTAILVNYQKPKPDAYSYIYALNWERVIRAFWWMTLIVLMQSFSGQLLATLVLNNDAQIDDLNELDRLNILPVVEKGSHEHSVFKTDNGTLYRRLYMKMLEQTSLSFIPPKNLTADSILDLIKQGKIALVNDMLTLKAALAKRFNSNRACGFYIAKERFSTNTFVMVLRKGLSASFYQEVNKRVLHIVESGIVADSIEGNVKDYAKCLGTEPDLKPLSVEDLRGIFILLGCGFLISGTIFVVELIHHLRHRK
ncbi:uncharacterized protein LOC106470002 [Limulus polyphemus]|uniref:Uncharacterized protein LOC106470002 n=1 Tax=Limulus polyphemus TaxID=6850 RepID=A0ABM1BP71_LIMPO|nr:uncharacterized protein LOC106470002 [Limulus polyphemus]